MSAPISCSWPDRIIIWFLPGNCAQEQQTAGVWENLKYSPVKALFEKPWSRGGLSVKRGLLEVLVAAVVAEIWVKGEITSLLLWKGILIWCDLAETTWKVNNRAKTGAKWAPWSPEFGCATMSGVKAGVSCFLSYGLKILMLSDKKKIKLGNNKKPWPQYWNFVSLKV